MSKNNLLEKYKYQIVAGGLVFGVLIILISIEDQPAITYEPQSSQTNVQQKEEAKPAFKAITLSGTGNKLTDPFDLESGGYKVTTEYSPTGLAAYIGVTLVDSTGLPEDLVANETEERVVSTSINVDKGEYRFRVEGDGGWTIKIEAL